MLRRTLLMSGLAAILAGACQFPEAPKPTPKELECVGAQAQTLKPGVLVVGSDLAFPPMESIDPQTQKPAGFEIDLVTEVAARMERRPEFVNQTRSGIIPALLTRRFDVVASSLVVTDELDAQVCTTEEFFEATQSLVVGAARAQDIGRTKDLKGKVVGVQTGTSGANWADRHLKRAAKEIKLFPTADDAYAALKAGGVDGLVHDTAVALSRHKSDAELKVVEEIETDEVYGFAVHPENGALMDEIDDALEQIEDDGTYEKIYERWFGRKP